jgi:uncharacterized metal-binding protein YceD (DUF177 family)
MTALPEMHRPVALGQIGTAGLEREVVATAAECAAIAARLLLPAVAALACRFRLSNAGAGVVLAEGRLTARVTQECVVTLDPFEVDLAEDFRVRFVPEDQFDADDDSIDLESDDEIPYAGSHIDLGDAAVEQLALALDPYPRKPGVALPEEGAPPPAEDAPPATSPFAALARRTQRG